MSGLTQIIQEMRPRCPHCRKSLDLGQFAQEIFERILRRINSGERVYVKGFGTFIGKFFPEREINSFGKKLTAAAHTQIHFRAAKHAKHTVNAGGSDELRSEGQETENPPTEREPPEPENIPSISQAFAGDEPTPARKRKRSVPAPQR